MSPLTLQIWFFASEVSLYSLQLSQLAVGWVDVCLTVGPANTKLLGFFFFCAILSRLEPIHAFIYCFPINSVPTIHLLLSDLGPVSHADLQGHDILD